MQLPHPQDPQSKGKYHFEYEIPLKTTSEANSREHWAVKHKRHANQKKAIWGLFMKERPQIILPCVIHIIRISPRQLDSDNLLTSLKYIRDAIAEQLIPGKAVGRADDSRDLAWRYSQEKGKPQAIKIILRPFPQSLLEEQGYANCIFF